MIVSVASGKGGTGKTLLATSLALALKERHAVQLLDCDVEEPDAHIFVKPVIDRSEAIAIPVPHVDETRCNYCGRCAEVCAYHAIAVLSEQVLTFPQLCHGCGACSYLCPEKAITEADRAIGLVESGQAAGISFVQGKLTIGEAMAPPVIREVKARTNDNGIVIIDAPPGTSCPVVESLKGSDFCLLVTEPTPFGLHDLSLAVAMVRTLNLPGGVIINRTMTHHGGVAEYCRQEKLPVLMTIPLDVEIARLYSQGVTLVDGMPAWRESFVGLWENIVELVSERNCRLKR